MLNLKNELSLLLRQNLHERIQQIHAALGDLHESMTNETKSSVGDKHETARAKMQFEQQKLQEQLHQVQQQLAQFNRLANAPSANQVSAGSLVHTSQGYFYLTISFGNILIANTNVMVVSLQSPIGQQLQGKQVNQTITFNNITYQILNIV